MCGPIKKLYIYKLTEETAKNIKLEVADSFTCLLVSIIRVLDFLSNQVLPVFLFTWFYLITTLLVFKLFN
jgi:hypothetical protein